MSSWQSEVCLRHRLLRSLLLLLKGVFCNCHKASLLLPSRAMLSCFPQQAAGEKRFLGFLEAKTRKVNLPASSLRGRTLETGTGHALSPPQPPESAARAPSYDHRTSFLNFAACWCLLRSQKSSFCMARGTESKLQVPSLMFCLCCRSQRIVEEPT